MKEGRQRCPSGRFGKQLSQVSQRDERPLLVESFLIAARAG
jgi:hypothetical protein